MEEKLIEYARQYFLVNSNLLKMFWFPEEEGGDVHILFIEEGYYTSNAIETLDVFIVLNQFGEQMLPMVVGTISPDFEGRPILPSKWCGWENAKLLWERT